MESFSNLLTTEAKIHGLFGLSSSLSFLEEICLAFQIHQPFKKKQIREIYMYIISLKTKVL